MSGAGSTRARDVDRVAVMAVIDDAHADGQLTGEEHRERVDQARQAVSLGDLHVLTADLQRSRPVPLRLRPTKDRRLRWTLIALAASVVSGLMAVVAVAVIHRDSCDDSTVPLPTPVVVPTAGDAPGIPTTSAPAPVMYTADAIREVIEATRNRFGTTVIEGMHLYPDSAEVYVYDKSSSVGSVRYQYSLGGEFHDPQTYGGTSVGSDNGETVDLADLDVGKIADLIAQSPEKLGVQTSDAGYRVTIGGADGGEVWIGVNDISIDSHLVARLDGTIKGVHRCGWGC